MKAKVFGEILWDVFEGEKKIGGAPFNFAAHLLKQGAVVELLSAVGKDSLGTEALRECERLGIETGYIAKLDYPTGSCRVTLKAGTPEYEIVKDVAYDHIPAAGCEKADVFYFGTLAQRAKESGKTLRYFLENGNWGQVFFDINIRQNFYTDETIKYSLQHATILKVSREEIGVFGAKGSCEDICRRLSETYRNLELIIVTLDSDGAFAFRCRTGEIAYSERPDCHVVSTVGAGDSFSAGFLTAYLKGSDLPKCLEAAGRVAGFVCSQVGAVPEYPEELKKLL